MCAVFMCISVYHRESYPLGVWQTQILPIVCCCMLYCMMPMTFLGLTVVIRYVSDVYGQLAIYFQIYKEKREQSAKQKEQIKVTGENITHLNSIIQNRQSKQNTMMQIFCRPPGNKYEYLNI